MVPLSSVLRVRREEKEWADGRGRCGRLRPVCCVFRCRAFFSPCLTLPPNLLGWSHSTLHTCGLVAVFLFLLASVPRGPRTYFSHALSCPLPAVLC
jgi:hypothetical protein